MLIAGEGFFEERPSYEKGREEMPEPTVEPVVNNNIQPEEQKSS
jgi:hypothetical protein